MPKPYSSKMPTSSLKTKTISVYLRGKLFEFVSAPDVFSQSKIDKGTQLLIEKMDLTNSDRVLDLGCGIGVIGIVAASIISPNSKVVLTDINRRAINLTKSNLKKNYIKNAEARWGDLYEPIQGDKETFDVIVTNPPVSSGMKTVFQIIEEAPLHLTSQGSLQLVIRRGHNRVYEKLNNVFNTVLEIGKKAGYHVYKSLI
ncbi:class I SAM-dependent methyltransferase [Candidatus Borrarchaeum sp.]|uniref:class I SAM-dependent methyltransferase n=1 Tax=Candidatus Borrarchaeum sp. TaxID=2846742 RepID=UPI00257ADCEC|nr:methyltransferase [Candidatus Borrarchaeum sp.]